MLAMAQSPHFAAYLHCAGRGWPVPLDAPQPLERCTPRATGLQTATQHRLLGLANVKSHCFVGFNAATPDTRAVESLHGY